MHIPRPLTPYFVVMNYPYSPDVDKFINDLLDRQPSGKISNFSVYLSVNNSVFQIWTTNKWYAYASRGGTEYSYTELWDKKRPSRRTMIRLHNYIKDYLHEDEPQLSLSVLLGEDINNGRQ